MVVEVVRYCIVHTMLVRYSWRIHEQSALQREGIGEEWEREREKRVGLVHRGTG